MLSQWLILTLHRNGTLVDKNICVGECRRCSSHSPSQKKPSFALIWTLIHVMFTLIVMYICMDCNEHWPSFKKQNKKTYTHTLSLSHSHILSLTHTHTHTHTHHFCVLVLSTFRPLCQGVLCESWSGQLFTEKYGTGLSVVWENSNNGISGTKTVIGIAHNESHNIG